jgi:hypothetical protein
LQKAAGLRSDPIASDPSATGTMRAASAAAAPPEEPPALRDGEYGLPVTPWTGLKLCDPRPNSGTLVMPIKIAPAARSRRGTMSSASGTTSAKPGKPDVQRSPATA